MFTEDDYDFGITTKVADEFIESHKAYNVYGTYILNDVNEDV